MFVYLGWLVLCVCVVFFGWNVRAEGPGLIERVAGKKERGGGGDSWLGMRATYIGGVKAGL